MKLSAVLYQLYQESSIIVQRAIRLNITLMFAGVFGLAGLPRVQMFTQGLAFAQASKFIGEMQVWQAKTYAEIPYSELETTRYLAAFASICTLLFAVFGWGYMNS